MTASNKVPDEMPSTADGLSPLREAECPFCERTVLVYEEPPRCPLCACPISPDRMQPKTFPEQPAPP